jgi:hypothetical protein
MTQLSMWLFHLGTALFLGSIATYCVVSTLAQHSGLNDLVFARRVVRSATLVLTVPGLWLAVLAQLLPPALKGNSLRLVPLGVAVVLLTLTHALIVPATKRCLALARESLAINRLVPAYHGAYLRETIPGAVNLVIALWAMAAIH